MVSSDQNKSYTSELVYLNKKYLVANGYEKLTVTGAVDAPASIPTGTTYMLIAVESATTSGVVMRYLETGAVPTTTDGMPLEHLTRFDVTGSQNVQNFKVIAVSGSHTLHIQYYR